MNFYDKMLYDYENAQKKYGSNTATKSNMTPADWTGIGLQLYGATLQDKAEEAERRREDEREDYTRLITGRRDREAAEQFERGAMQTERGQNISGFDRLADMRERAMKNAQAYSFRNSFLKAMGA